MLSFSSNKKPRASLCLFIPGRNSFLLTLWDLLWVCPSVRRGGLLCSSSGQCYGELVQVWGNGKVFVDLVKWKHIFTFFNEHVKQKDMRLQERTWKIYFYFYFSASAAWEVHKRRCSTGSGWRKAGRGSPSSRLPAQRWTKLGHPRSPPWGRWCSQVPCNQLFCGSAGSSTCIKSIL